MTRCGATLGKNHRPCDVGWTSEQLAVDEIADAPQTQSDRDRRANQVRDLPEIPALLSRDPHRGDEDADEAAVERHTALPYRKDRKRIAKIAAEIIENHIAQPAADHDSEDQIE